MVFSMLEWIDLSLRRRDHVSGGNSRVILSGWLGYLHSNLLDPICWAGCMGLFYLGEVLLSGFSIEQGGLQGWVWFKKIQEEKEAAMLATMMIWQRWLRMSRRESRRGRVEARDCGLIGIACSIITVEMSYPQCDCSHGPHNESNKPAAIAAGLLTCQYHLLDFLHALTHCWLAIWFSW